VREGSFFVLEADSMSLALYRKYRPGTFAEVIGQEHVTGPICQALDSGRIHHAYLFSGPRGCGKTSSARILARSLNCEKGPTSTPCGVCDSCVALAPMGPGSLDVIEIDAASHGLVDDARDLRERAFYAPVSSRFKIYVIDEAHMITTAAFNALLKVVEEPPAHVKFIFATTEPEKVLGTIKSRTFHYRFRLIPPQVMRDHLAALCAKEGITVDPLVLPLIVRAGGGSARDSQSILDQLAAGSDSNGISYDRALALLGYTDAALLEEVVDAFAAGDGAAVFRSVDRVIEAGLEPRRFIQDLLERFRDLLILDAVPDAAETGLLDAPADELERMRSQAAQYGRPQLSRAADLMAEALIEMRGTTSPRLVLELACARVLLPGASQDSAALLVRLDRLERRLSATGVADAPAAVTPAVPVTAQEAPAPPVPAPAAQVAPEAEARDAADDLVVVPEPVAASAPPAAPAPVAAAPAGTLDLVALRQVWELVLEAVKKRSRLAYALVIASELESLDNQTLTLAFSNPTLAGRFNDDVADNVKGAITEVVGVELKLRTSSGGQTAAAGLLAAVPAPSPVIDLDAHDVDDSVDADSDRDAPPKQDPTDSALALLKSGLGAEVIGEIDRS
jgi:DNA polymerase III subunit gamma/tau